MRKLLVLLFIAATAVAQEDPVATARRLARSGDRAQAIAILEQRLKAAPNDTDARTLYGTLLGSNGNYAEARRQLKMVLEVLPNDPDAQQALARVSNEVTIGGTLDSFRNSDDWREAEIDLKVRQWVFRAAHGRRFGLNDDQLEVEAYPRIGAKSYAYLNAGFSPDGDLYPKSRFGAEIFGGFGKGYEASIGFRRLNFDDAVNIATASLSKYYGDWLFTLRGYHSDGSNSEQLLVRRYFGANYVGVRIGKGSTRDEIRSITDIQVLDSTDIVVEAKTLLGQRWSLQTRVGASTGDVKHTVTSALLGLRF